MTLRSTAYKVNEASEGPPLATANGCFQETQLAGIDRGCVKT